MSNFTFVSHPSTIADDIGSDFFCAIFDKVSHKSRDYLVPGESFAIQIKSSNRSFSIDGKTDYLRNLSIPFFVGVINKDNQELDLYSGEYLILFFVDKPKAIKVRVKLCGSIGQSEPYF